MLSRIFWVSAAGIALVAGMVIQGDWNFDWPSDEPISERTARTVEEKVDRAIDASFDKMTVVQSDGREIDLPAETKRAMATAVGELVKAETDLALAKIGEDDEEAIAAATVRRDRARAEVDRMKDKIEALERSSQVDKDALREQIRREIQEDVRATVRESVRS
jgi:hypothetical protein